MNAKKLPISIIVACYNNSEYLPECIESINIEPRPTEIIIIDDCSTDSSFQIAKKLEMKHDNIRLLRTESNSGAAAARQVGLLAATEDLVAWVDSDDFIEPGAIADAYSRICNEVDLCIFELWRWPACGEPYKSNANPCKLPLSGKEAVLETLDSWRMHTAGVCRKKIYLDSYKELNINSFNSDEILSRIILQKSRKIIGTQKRYFYRENLHSTTKKVSDKHLSGLRSNIWLIKFSIELNSNLFNRLVANSIAQAWSFYKSRNLYTRKIFISELRRFLESILEIKSTWKIAIFSPKHFAALLYLIAYSKFFTK